MLVQNEIEYKIDKILSKKKSKIKRIPTYLPLFFSADVTRMQRFFVLAVHISIHGGTHQCRIESIYRRAAVMSIPLMYVTQAMNQ